MLSLVTFIINVIGNSFWKIADFYNSFFLFFQIDPYSVAAKDGRIREGDQIVQVNKISVTYLIDTDFHYIWLIIQVKIFHDLHIIDS